MGTKRYDSDQLGAVKVRLVLFASLALALSACRSSPPKPSVKATASETAPAGIPSAEVRGPAGPDSAGSMADTANFVDHGFPNEDQPELVTARKSFPTAFGFDDGPPKKDVNHALIYTSRLFDRLATPPPYCLNSVAQPSIADLQLRLLLSTNTDETQRTFSVKESLVLKDRSRHYVIAVPKGAHGVLMLPPPAPSFGRYDNQGTDERFSVVLSDVTVIYPDGHSFRMPPGDNDNIYAGGAILVVSSGMRVRLCANDPRYKANGCPDSNPRVRVPDPPPRDFDLRRCEPGCEQACTRKEISQHRCPAPPAPRCVGDKQRVFLDGREAGGYCVFEEWDIQCEGGCTDGQCAGAPRLAWSRKIAAGYLAFRLDAQTLALTEGDELITISADGEQLQRDKPFKVGLARIESDEHGQLFTLDRLNVLRAHRKQPWSLELDSAAPAFEAGLRSHGDKLAGSSRSPQTANSASKSTSEAVLNPKPRRRSGSTARASTCAISVG